MNPVSTSVIVESVGGYNITLSTSFDRTALWISESTNDLVCSTSQYKNGGTCTDCSSSCSMCSGAGLSNCISTNAYYFDRGLDSSDVIYWVPRNSNAASMELWAMPNAWDISSQPVVFFQPFVLIQRKASTSNIVFVNSVGEEKLQISMPVKEWMHIAITREGTTNVIVKIYINGILQFNGQWTLATEAITNIWLGRSSLTAATGVNFNGVFQELRLWSEVRTATQISNFMNVRMSSPYLSTLTEYWPLNNGPGTVISDIKNSVSIYKTIIGNLWRQLDCKTEGCKLLCVSGFYFDLITGTCLACDISCGLCNAGGASNCLTCASNYSLQVSGTSNCYSVCPSGFIQLTGTTTCAQCLSSQFINNGACTNCDSSCLTCSGSTASQCLSCPSTRTLVLGQCVSPCSSGQYRDTVTTCRSCSSTCTSCNGATSSNCLTCNSELLLSNGSCLSSCPGSTYQSGSTCLSCHQSCGTCNGGTEVNCLTCNSGFPYRDSTGKCVTTCSNLMIPSQNLCVDFCPAKFYSTNSQCLPCDLNCSECTGPLATNCATCVNNFLFQGQCYTTCPDGTYRDGTTCYSCHISCSTCSGPNSYECINCSATFPYRELGTNICVSTCNPTYYLVSTLSQCVQTCPLGFFISGQTCQSCSSSCVSCSGISTSCTACFSGEYLDVNKCEASCPSTKFVDDQICSSCNSACATCNGPLSSNCLSCPTNQYLATNNTCVAGCTKGLFVLNGVCLTQCPSGYYQSSTTNDCLACESTCLNCNGPLDTNCLSCGSNRALLSTSCVLACPISYFNDTTSNVCKSCASGCDLCTGSEYADCIRCSNDQLLYLNNASSACVISCPLGSYQNGTKCDTCSSALCQKCENQLSCQLCQSGAYLNSQNNAICSAACSAGEIQDATNKICTGYTKLYPLSTVALSNLTRIQITYPFPISKGIGNINIYRISSSGNTLILNFNTNSASVLIIDTILSIAVTSQTFSYNTQYTIEITSGTIVSSNGSPNVAIPVGS